MYVRDDIDCSLVSSVTMTYLLELFGPNVITMNLFIIFRVVIACRKWCWPLYCPGCRYTHLCNATTVSNLVFIVTGDFYSLYTNFLEVYFRFSQLVSVPSLGSNVIDTFFTSRPDLFQVDVFSSLTFVVLILFLKGISRLLDEIETKFQRLSPIFDDGQSNRTIGETVRCNRKWKTKMAVSKHPKCVSQLVHKIATKFQRLCLCFRDPTIK